MTTAESDRTLAATRDADGAALGHVVVVGLGYVGLPTALGLTARGAMTTGLDVSEARISAIRQGRVELIPADRRRLGVALRNGELALTTDPAILATADAVIICVPTPVDRHLVPDLGPLTAATASVVRQARPGQLIIVTSTSYVGTTRDLVIEPLLARGLRPGIDVNVAFSPERVDPGNERFTMQTTPRIVGGLTGPCARRAVATLSHLTPRTHVVSSLETAELAKLHENTFRAVNIAYANEIADICRLYGLDATEVIDAAATKPYGFMAFRPGSGAGGHCIPCDPHYLLWHLNGFRRSAPLIEAAMRGIAERPARVVERVTQLLAEHRARSLTGARVLVVGVAYKPGVEDVRESPAVEIIERLTAAGADVCFRDPLVEEIRLSDGTVIRGLTSTEIERYWDLVVVHTLHPDESPPLPSFTGPVLDCTYRSGAWPRLTFTL